MKTRSLLAVLLAGMMALGISVNAYAADAASILAEAKAKAENKAAEVQVQETAALEETADAELQTDAASILAEAQAQAESVPTEEAEENVVPAEMEVTDEAELSDDLYSFQMKVGGEIYQFPMTYDEFASKGWELDDYEDPAMMVESNSYTSVGMVKDGNYVYADVINFDINAVPITECFVGGMEIDISYTDFDYAAMPVILPRGIAIGTAEIEDIKHVYGEPSDVYESEYRTSLTYELDLYQSVELNIDSEMQVLSQIDIRNYVEPEDFDKGAVSTDIPDIVSAYQAPTAIGEEMLSPVVEYFGDLYQLPAPLSAFTANGWEIQDAEDGAYIAGDDFEAVDLMKDNQIVTLYVSNLTSNAVLLEYGFVEELSYGSYESASIAMKLSGDVSLGMEKEDLIALADSNGYICEDEEDYLRIYANEDTQYDQYLSFGFYDDENPTKVSSMSIYWQ